MATSYGATVISMKAQIFAATGGCRLIKPSDEMRR
jgi:hypothetical protein